jgi:ATP-dependent Clp protease ATP-binding subunit ClpC
VFDVFSMPARSAVTRAHQEARTHGNDYIGTEHLLLGVLDANDDGAVVETLRSFNVTRQAVRWRVEDSIGPVGEPQPGHVPFTPRAKSTLQRSRYEAEVRGHHRVEPSDILAALMWESESAAAKAVASLGVHPADVRGHVISDGQSTGE